MLTVVRYARRRLGLLVAVSVLGLNVVVAVPYIQHAINARNVDSVSYEAKYGHWDTIELPTGLRVNAVHAALLDTGKILITAGSGNNLGQFKAGSFKTLVYDPTTGTGREVYTPTDLFCGGQSFLSNGDVLIAGGTQNYEVLARQVTHAGGVVTIKNESAAPGLRIMLADTEVVSSAGQKYRTDAEVILQPAALQKGPHGKVTVIPSATNVWVNAESRGPAANLHVTTPVHFTITGLVEPDSRNIYGLATQMNMDKQDFEGTSFSYIFDPKTEEYTRVADLTTKRWYPTLTPLSDGSVLAVSGLDGTAQIVKGVHETEQWVPAEQRWIPRPDLSHYFATYPALFQTENKAVLFYSSSNSGYGLGTQGRQPGFWNIDTNAFTPVPGLRDPGQNETSSSAWVGPVQDQTIAIVGGGGVGTSKVSTGRIDVIKLDATNPHYIAGPSLPRGTRYPQLVTLPDDTMLITGGSRYYRGEHASDNHVARIYHPTTNTLSVAASPLIGRDYHSEALLLPDGRVITMGGNPLYADKADTISGTFEQRLEIYTPAYLYRGARPVIASATASVAVGGVVTVASRDADAIVTARLIRPGAATHQLDLEQGSFALQVSHRPGSVALTLPSEVTLVPPGDYMLFVLNSAGVPSIAKWVHVATAS
jgi:hypothetical protein